MEKTYSLNDLAMMTGFTTRTLRNYLNQGLLTGEKDNGVWKFTAEDLDCFFREPFVKEGLRIKRSAAVFDFMAGSSGKQERSCVVLDIPASLKKGSAISAFFCDMVTDRTDVQFSYGWDKSFCRVILTGAAEPMAEIMKAYYETRFED